HREGRRRLPERHATEPRHPARRGGAHRRLARRLPAAREGGRVPRALARWLRQAEGARAARAGVDPLRAPGRLSHLPKGARAHGLGGLMRRTIDSLFALLVLVAACKRQGASTPTFSLTSPAFKDGDAIPAAFTCDGANHSPPLAWSGVPKTTAAYALVADDPD